MSVPPENYRNLRSAQAQPAVDFRPPWFLVLLIAIAFVPEDYGFKPFGVRLGFARALLVFAAPLAVIGYVRLASSRLYRFVLSDLLMPVTAVWMIFASSMTEGAYIGFVHGGAIAADFVLSYALMRTLPRNTHEIYA